MKAVRYDRFGPPQEVAACAEVPDPGSPAADEVVIEMEACPINPVDLLTIEGRYAVRPALPATPGSEGVGRVLAAGDGVRGLAPGDRVLHLGRDNWVQHIRAKAAQVIKTPAGADVGQLAMAKINPATALLMLRNYRVLGPGDWVLQDAANSGVGTCLIRLAHEAGLHSVNVVRREGWPRGSRRSAPTSCWSTAPTWRSGSARRPAGHRCAWPSMRSPATSAFASPTAWPTTGWWSTTGC